MHNERESISLFDVAGGSAPHVFQRAVAEIMANIDDANTNPKQKRKIVMEFIFAPSESREVGEVQIVAKLSKAGPKPIVGTFYLSRTADGKVVAYARDPKQDELFAEKPAPIRPV